MKKVTKLFSVLYSFLIFGTVLNINCRWPWEEKSREVEILMYGPFKNGNFGNANKTKWFTMSNRDGDNKNHHIILTN